MKRMWDHAGSACMENISLRFRECCVSIHPINESAVRQTIR
jgi:hypothetical protein